MTVTFDRALATKSFIFAMAFLWPLFIFGRPTYLPGDSLAYLKTGHQAVEFVSGKFSSSADALDSAGAMSPIGKTRPVHALPGADTKTARSVTYSVATYVLRWPGQNLSALAIVQALAASILCAIIGSVLGMRRWRFYVVLAALVAFATPLAPFAAFIVPDIWAGILLGAITLLIATGERLSLGAKACLALFVIFGISAHPSIPPIAAGMAVIGVMLYLFQSRFALKMPTRSLGWLLLPVFLGFGVNVAVNYISFGKASATGKRIPTALARTIALGPGRWYLEEQCRVPRYAVCEIYGTKIPSTINGFLFNKGSLNDLATPEQMDRIRAEESEIILRAAFAYPGAELGKLSVGILRQLITFDLGLTNFKRQLAFEPDGTPVLVETGEDHSVLLSTVDALAIILLAVCAVWVLLQYRRLHADERAMLWLLSAGILGNAVVCSVFSGVAERYQARIIWLFPTFVLCMIAARLFPGKGTNVAE